MKWPRPEALILIAGVISSTSAAAIQEPPPEDVVALAGQIEALERQIGALLQSLPPAVRSAVEAELARRRGTSTAAGPQAEPQAEAPTGPVSKTVSAAPAPRRPDPDRVAVSPRGCTGLEVFDTNDDGLITGADRFWRHFYVALDAGGGDRGGGAVETLSVFDVGVRQIRLDLRGTINDRGGQGRMEIEPTRVRVEATVKRRRGAQFGTLMLDADGLARAGGPRLRLASGTEVGDRLEGMVALRSGLVIESDDRTAVTVTCH